MWFVIMFSPCTVWVLCRACEIFFFRNKDTIFYLFFLSLPNVYHGRSLHVFIYAFTLGGQTWCCCRLLGFSYLFVFATIDFEPMCCTECVEFLYSPLSRSRFLHLSVFHLCLLLLLHLCFSFSPEMYLCPPPPPSTISPPYAFHFIHMNDRMIACCCKSNFIIHP